MKRFQNILMAVAASALAVVSCAKEEVAPETTVSEDKVYEYLFTLGEGDSKAMLNDNVVTWQTGDYLGVVCKYAGGGYSYSNSNTKSEITPASGETPAKFLVKSYNQLTSGGKVFCFFPYINTEFKTPEITMSIPASQNNTINEMPMASIPFTVTTTVPAKTGTEVGDIKMLMLGSIARYKIYSSNADWQGETIKSVEFKTASTDIAGSFKINIENIDLSNANTLAVSLSANKSKSITESISDKTVTDNKENGIVDMVIAPGTYSGTLTITTDAAKYEFTLNNKEFQRAHIKPFAVNLASDNCTRTENPVSHDYKLVETDLGDDWSGDYLIVYNNTYAMNTHYGNQNANTYATYTNISQYYNSSDKSIAVNDVTNALVYTAEKKTTGYSLYCNADESYLGIASGTTSAGSKLRWNTSYSESACEWILGVGSIQNVGSPELYIRWNNNSGDYRFSTYLVDGQQAIQLFRLPSTAPKITDGEIDEFPARSTSGRYTVQTKNITTDLEILDWDGVDFDEIEIENGNEIVYTVSDNGSTSAKEGTITVALASDHSVKGTITVSQAAAVFNAARTSVNLKAAANSQTTVTITSDFDWTITGVDEGYTVSPSSFNYDPEATEPGKKTITIKANNANDGDATLDLGIFKIVNSKNELGSIEITVNQLSSKLPAPTIINVSGNNKDKQATIQWNKVTNATAYTYYLIDDDASEITSSRATTTDNNVLSATVDIPEYGENYYFCIFAVGDGEDWLNSTEATSNAINLTEPVEPTGTTYEWSFPTSGSVSNETGFKDKNSTSGTMLKAYTSKNAVNSGSWTCISNGAYFNLNSYFGIQVPINSATTGFEISAALFGWKSSKYAAKSISKVTYYTTAKSAEVEITPSGSPSTTTSGCYNLELSKDFASGYKPSSDTNQYLYIRIYMAAGNDGFESLAVTVNN